ncbi:MAG: flagellar hook-length control protein FliK [Arcobacter sp.]|nr:flagellar hook-length control protein FliK [Arcobacter sp.]
MANLIDSLSKNKSLVSESSSKNEKETIKEGPSLFDSLIKENSEESIKTDSKTIINKEESKTISIEKEQPKTETLVENDNVDNIEKSVETSETSIEESKVNSKTENRNNQSGSLLDRLVFEAKKELETPISSLSNEINDNNIVLEEVLVVNVDQEQAKTENSVEIIENSEKSTVDVKIENKDDETSLFDKLLNKNNKSEIINTINNQANENNGSIEKVPTDIIENNNVINPEIIVNEQKNEASLENEKNLIKTEQTSSLVGLITETKNNSGVEILDENIVSENLLENNESLLLKDTTQTPISNEETFTDFDKNKTETSSVLQSNLNLDIEEANVDNEVNATENKLSSLKQENVLSNVEVEKNLLNEENLIDSSKPKEKQSLMDLLILKNSKNSLLVENEQLIKNQSSSNEFISNMYLSSQKNVVTNQLLFNKREAMSLLQEGQTLKDVEKSADILDLGLENLGVEQTLGTGKKVDLNQEDLDILNRKSILDKLFIEKNIKNDDIKGLITQSIEASKALIDDTLTVQDDVALNVNSPLSYNIQSRIIGAKQQMSMMMSDIARQMYENYKPPVTVFKINLNPLELGSISILMKNDRNNGLNISMNVSNMTTLDALIENQNMLKNSLNKTFEESTVFNLDFNSSNHGDSQSQNNQSNQEERFGREQIDTQTVLQLKEENKDREDNLDYM